MTLREHHPHVDHLVDLGNQWVIVLEDASKPVLRCRLREGSLNVTRAGEYVRGEELTRIRIGNGHSISPTKEEWELEKGSRYWEI